QPHAEPEETPDPSDEYQEEARQAEPVEPRHADRVPPGHEQGRQKAAATGAERNGVERDHRAPDARDEHRRREEEQQKLPDDLPEGIAVEHRSEHQRLPIEDPREAAPDPAPHGLENPAPLLGLGGA